MNAHEYKVRSIGDASVEKVEVGVFPDEIEYGCPDDCFEDVKNNIGGKICEVNGVKFKVYNGYPYCEMDMSKENVERYIKLRGLKFDADNELGKIYVQFGMSVFVCGYAHRNNWRKRHGFVKIKRKIYAKRISEYCYCRNFKKKE